MQLVNANILLSASDLTGFLECAHLTRLELEAVRGERSRPAETDPATEVVARWQAAGARVLRTDEGAVRFLSDGRAVRRAPASASLDALALARERL